MKKHDFVKRVAERTETMSMGEVEIVLKAFEDAILEDIFEGEDSVRFSFGTLSGFAKTLPARSGINPFTKQPYSYGERVVHGYPKFKPSGAAKPSAVAVDEEE